MRRALPTGSSSSCPWETPAIIDVRRRTRYVWPTPLPSHPLAQPAPSVHSLPLRSPISCAAALDAHLPGPPHHLDRLPAQPPRQPKAAADRPRGGQVVGPAAVAAADGGGRQPPNLGSRRLRPRLPQHERLTGVLNAWCPSLPRCLSLSRYPFVGRVLRAARHTRDTRILPHRA